MLFRTLFALLLSAGTMWAQAQPTVAPGDAVITIDGVCSAVPPASNTASSCTTVVTREELEKLAAALAAEGQAIPPNARRNLAEAYANLLTFESAAKKAGLEGDPQYQQLLRWQYLRTLSSIYRRDLEHRYANPTQHDIDEYYRQNPSKFTEMKLQRIMIPRKDPSAAAQGDYEKRALAAANQARERMVKGEDADQVHKDAYAALGSGQVPPAADLGMRRKMSLLPEEGDEIFSLDPGAVSKVEYQQYNYVIYRVVSKHLLPEESVKQEISVDLSKQRVESALKAVTSSAHSQFNEQYFGPEPKPRTQSAPSPTTQSQPPPGQPPARPFLNRYVPDPTTPLHGNPSAGGATQPKPTPEGVAAKP